MPRGDLLKKLFASYKRQEEFRNVALEIIGDEERKKKIAFARALRKSLEAGTVAKISNGSDRERSLELQPLPREREKIASLVDIVRPVRRRSEIILSDENANLFSGVVEEFRQGQTIRNHGLRTRSKLLFCGPPGCGKTLCAEVFAHEVGMPLIVARIDVLISSYLGETSNNIRKVFDYSAANPSVLLLDEFDALARSRDDETEHGELRRVVNSLLQLIDRYEGNGFIIAATNFDGRLDPAIWRRFDEVVFFNRPTVAEIRSLLAIKLKNFPVDFAGEDVVQSLVGLSHAEIERICINAIKRSILSERRSVSRQVFHEATEKEVKRRRVIERFASGITS